MGESLPYVQFFCRMAISLIFALSCTSKLRQFAHFQLTIIKFHLMPLHLVRVAALLFVSSEGLIVILLAGGGPLVDVGFVLALCLLILFTTALGSVLVRRLKVACQCFGSSDKDVSSIDLWRNAGLLLCTTAGFITTVLSSSSTLTLVSYILLALMALVFVIVWVQLHEVVQLFQ